MGAPCNKFQSCHLCVLRGRVRPESRKRTAELLPAASKFAGALREWERLEPVLKPRLPHTRIAVCTRCA
eukprot:365169-Chlamydomonas_euryale.AAC.9